MVPLRILWSMPCKSVAPGSKTQLAEIATFTASPRWYKHVLFRSVASHGCTTDVFPPAGSAHTCNTTFRGNQEWKRRRAVQNFGVKRDHFMHNFKERNHVEKKLYSNRFKNPCVPVSNDQSNIAQACAHTHTQSPTVISSTARGARPYFF